MVTTTDRHALASAPIRTVTATVVEGPERGRTIAGETISVGTATTNDLVLSDRAVSRFHVDVLPDPAGLRIVDRGSKNGTFAGDVRLRDATLRPGASLRVGGSTILLTDGPVTSVGLGSDELGEYRGWSVAARRLIAEAARASASDASVLLLGESGTGKELLARGIHAHSTRAKASCEVVDCASLVPNLVASELFGHERGAFTGADRRHVGAFERAHGGTLFLDEIGDLPQDVQPLLLGALERRGFRRLGGSAEIHVDVRVISATHRDLRDAVNTGRFRLDLYYRIAVLRLTAPPLRERTEDIAPLIAHFAARFGASGATVAQLLNGETRTALERHTWPGNVRELRNIVESSMVMGKLPVLDASFSPSASNDDLTPLLEPLLSMPWGEARSRLVSTFERRYIEALIRKSGGNVALAARTAEMDRSHLIDLLKKHKLK